VRRAVMSGSVESNSRQRQPPSTQAADLVIIADEAKKQCLKSGEWRGATI
jgi:hypothetical protein